MGREVHYADGVHINKAMGEGREKGEGDQNNRYYYKLGEEIANGVRFWGQESIDKNNSVTAMCICPVCDNTWRIIVSKIRTGNVRSCCGRGRNK